MLPETYRSSAVMRITPSNDPKQITGEAASRPVPEWVTRLQQRILSRSSLAEMIQRPALDLYREQRAREPLEQILENMRKRDIVIRMLRSPAGADSSFMI